MITILKKFIKQNHNIEYAARMIRNILPFHKRLSKHFWEYYSLLNETQYYDMKCLQGMQFELLKQSIANAYQHSAFYKKLYNDYDIHLRDIQSFEDFKKMIPIVDKSVLKNAADLTVFKSNMYSITTSGTSGAPFQFFGDKESREKELAAIYHQWNRAGFSPNDKRIEMRGFQIEPILEYPDLNTTRFSIVNMNHNIKQMVDYINKTQISYIHGYPSAVAKFAGLLKDNSLTISHEIKGVFLASENMYSWQVDRVQEVLNPQTIIAHYGNSEQVALGAWCQKSRSYHFLPLYGYIEKGESNEIISTGFLNRVTPFIRYKLNDILLDWSEEMCPHCGRGYTPLVKQIGGRLEDYLVDEKGELIPPAVVTFPFKHLHLMKEVQVIQKENKNIVLRYRVDGIDNELLAVDKNELGLGFKKMLGNSIQVYFEKVSDIKLTDACKFKWIISECNKKIL